MTTKFSISDKFKNFLDNPSPVDNVIEELGDSQDKLRAVLNLFFVPTFRPEFVNDGYAEASIATLSDVEFLSVPKPQKTQSPYRMFDVDEGKLVEASDMGSQYLYCMLSHRWKGDEINLQYITGARADYDKFKKGMREKLSNKNDVQLVLWKCVRDIQQQAYAIQKLSIELQVKHNMCTLLDMYFNDKRSHKDREKALKKKDKEADRLKDAKMEREVTLNYVPKEVVAAGAENDDTAKEIKQLVDEAQKRFDNVTQALSKADKDYKKYQSDREFFQNMPDLKNEVEEMVRRLQRWKSAVKIWKSILRAREIFNKNPFGENKKRYIWLDTCCINKLNAGELSESLSLMGDWYAQSEFTLVQLEASKPEGSDDEQKYSEYDARYDWLEFLVEQGTQNTPDVIRSWLHLEAEESKREKREAKNIGYNWLQFLARGFLARGTQQEANSVIIDLLLVLATESKQNADSSLSYCLDFLLQKAEQNANSTIEVLLQALKKENKRKTSSPISGWLQYQPMGVEQNVYNALYSWLKIQAETEKEKDIYEKRIPVLTLDSFDKIHSTEPEWSKRGWTLQELVMSKMTFYVNSNWQLLTRPVERLGRFYHLIPYISMYLNHNDKSVDKDTLAEYQNCDIKKLYEIVSESQDSDTDQNVIEDDMKDKAGTDEQVTRALLVLAILDSLNVQFPKEMTKETAKSQMAQAVFFAVDKLAEEKNGVLIKLKNLLVEELPSPEEGENDAEVDKRRADYVIDFMLRLLVFETNALIKNDRGKIAEFGKVDRLKEWSLGTQGSTGFVTQDVMALSRPRKVTKPIDRIYSLMGILGVRFPTFPAEGYCKALSRLLDEIIIAHNDVSVFNWTGFNMSSPIRGRSMYPSSHKAYLKDNQRNEPNHLVWEQQKEGLDDLMKSYHGITSLLVKAIEYVKDKKLKPTAMKRMKEILNIVNKFSFLALYPEITNLHKIVEHVASTHDMDEKESKEKAPTTSPTQASRFLGSGIRTLSSGVSQLKEQKSGLRLMKFGKGNSKPETLKEIKPGPPSLLSSTATLVDSPTLVESPIQDSTSGLSKDDEEKIDSYLAELSEISGEGDKIPGKRKPLPDKIQNTELQKEVQRPVPHDSNTDTQSSSMICPNPIIINNAGIEGTFDIQRVIVTMQNKDILRRQVAQAVSSRQRISGWCTISTGFAAVIVHFSCEKQHLANQLQVVDSVDKHVLTEQGEQRGKHLVKGMFINNMTSSSKKGLKDSDQARKKDASKSSTVQKSESPEGIQSEQKPDVDDEMRLKDADADDEDYGEEERLISRMIKFVQEEDVRLVAGEWVLARFSGVGGAKWFLCSLELGSSHHFYGHRIATNEIDFSEATPEKGLVKVWKNYMNRKKHKMWDILRKYLDSMENRELSDIGSGLLAEILSQAKSLDTPQISTQKKNNVIGSSTTEIEANDGNDSDDSDDTVDADDEDQFRGAKDILQLMGGIGVVKIMEFIDKKRAGHMERHLSSLALKGTPKILHPAVENLDDNRNFLPTMFHSGKRIHMF
ncbi:hypothetical protein ACHAQJ_002249 [Trichoderma viride]